MPAVAPAIIVDHSVAFDPEGDNPLAASFGGYILSRPARLLKFFRASGSVHAVDFYRGALFAI